MKRTLTEINADFIREQREAAKDPNHPLNLKMISFFEERTKKLEILKRNQDLELKDSLNSKTF